MFDDLIVPSDFSTLTDDELKGLDTQARTAAKPLLPRAQGEGDPLTEDEAAGLRKLGDVVTRVRGERETRLATASTNAANGRKTADAVAAFAADAPKDEEPKDEEPKPENLTAGSGRVRVGDAARNGNGQVKVVNATATDAASGTVLIAAPNLPNVNAGSVFANIAEIGVAAEAVMASYPRGGGGQYVKTPVAYMKRDYAADLRINEKMGKEEIETVLDFAGSTSRLEGGQASLVAAAGWCAPSQIDYGLMELETDAGLLDLPEVQVSRGGLQYTTGPDFSSIFAGAGYFHQTEAQVIAATVKPCMVIPCPSFTETRLEVEGVCITGAFLQDRGYPEMVARFVRGAMTAHVHKLNIFKINKLVAGSTLFDYTNVANLAVTTSEYKDFSTISHLLAVIGIQVMDYRAKYRMAPTAMLEAVMPYWLIESVRADVQRRTGQDADVAFNVALSQINSWFNVRGVRVQWVYDWLDAYNTTNTSTVGQTAGIYTLPVTVEVLLYAAGTWVAGVADVVRLDTVYDSTNLALNQYTQLFTEEGVMVMKRGFESRRIKVRISPSGVTSATADMRTG
jgi:hypothetical protein